MNDKTMKKITFYNKYRCLAYSPWLLWSHLANNAPQGNPAIAEGAQRSFSAGAERKIDINTLFENNNQITF